MSDDNTDREIVRLHATRAGLDRFTADLARGTVVTRFEPLIAIAEGAWSKWLDAEPARLAFDDLVMTWSSAFMEAYREG